ncbi:hypothetical protein Vretifemale_19443 [Volvox reticuliferus]|uniref:Anaphase-promoting complex subunit 4 WD40 domain-containing protein n=1 Tax=Volvox reticuliferus TaxID=1737510 RepID=A0A8J4CZF5_9CHLO|nr:hypothetical protein Vretifemale_19443 [Volvox reticuliferus]
MSSIFVSAAGTSNSIRPSQWKAHDDCYYQEWINEANIRPTCCDVFWHPDAGEVLLVADEEGHISLWRIAGHKLLWTSRCLSTEQRSTSPTTACKAISGGRAFVTGHRDGSIKKWDIKQSAQQSAQHSAPSPPSPQLRQSALPPLSAESTQSAQSPPASRAGPPFITNPVSHPISTAATTFSSTSTSCAPASLPGITEAAVHEEQQPSSISNGDDRRLCSLCTLEVTCNLTVRQPSGDPRKFCDIRIAVSRYGERILTHAYEVNTVVCWNTSDMEAVKLRSCDKVICSALSEDGKEAILVSHRYQNSTIYLWDITNDRFEEQLLEGPDTGRLDIWDISWPAKLVAAANEDGSLCVWDVEKGRYRTKLRYKTEFNHGARSCCRFSPCGQFILVGGRNVGEIVLLESKYGQELLRAYPPAQGNFTTMTATGCFFRMPSSSSSSSSGDQVVVTVTADGGRREDDYSGFHQRYIQFTREGLVKEPPKPSPEASLGRLLPITFPTRFGAVYSDGSIRIFDIEGVSYTESRQLVLEDQQDRISHIIDIDVSGDGKLLFVILACVGGDRAELRVYDIDSSKPIWQFTMETLKQPDNTHHVISSGDSGLVSYETLSSGRVQQCKMQGKVVWSDGNDQVHLYDLSKLEQVMVIDTQQHHSSIWGVYPQVNRNFDHMVTTTTCGSDAWVCCWDLSTGELIRKYHNIHRDGILGAWFIADGSRCVSVSTDRTAALFKLDETGEVIMRFVGHEDSVTFAALSPNEAILATASRDQTVRIWDVDTGGQLHAIRYGKQISRIHFLQSSRWIITTDKDGDVIGFDTTGRSVSPLIFQGYAVVDCKIMKLHPMPSSETGQPPLVFTVNRSSIINVLHLHTLSIRQPLRQRDVWLTGNILTLAKAFPGLAVAPAQPDYWDVGNTYLHDPAW